MTESFYCFSGSVVRSKWKSLRDTYRKELHKMPKVHSGDDGSQAGWKSTWKHFDTLSFLQDQFVVRSSGGNLPNTETTRPEENEESAESDIEKLPLAENESSVVTPAQTKRKRPSDEIGATLVRLEERKMELLEKNTTQAEKRPKRVDDDVSFFNSLLPYMKSLSPPEKLLCRMQIQEVVYRFITNARHQTFAPQSGPVEQAYQGQQRPTTSLSCDQNEFLNSPSVSSYYSNFSDELQ